ncbi:MULTISPECIES: ATP-binding protein [Wolbachia]|uniref:ATP-binding protein n=1 Tax=Wolbachia TaxID=953 RepID=UPI00042075C3|nr:MULTISPECIES: ATP-binding protein [Wolbachia]POG50110.1 hypothetical protein BK222_02140 [Wolbachia sp. wMel_AMD]TLW84124.1 ATP-binding protein [Wolbachia endosymbiont of Drosophila teissieri]MCE4149239.1 ATP-binding protein [Wolbachia endosymbiont of Drosophila melanogaster]MCE4151029.1 ATP-binding protein [Wolbachia endosymbiont of Drosophila melanogaster]QEC81091.1 ATP-binding protein [Wolbachia pipientis]
MRNPVGSFTGRTEELRELHKLIQKSQGVATVISQLVSISGLGGIGKTELAKKYIEEHSKDYDNNIIWIKAETHETMVQSFLRLARDPLGIPTEDRDIESIVRDIYAFFAKRKVSLFSIMQKNIEVKVKMLVLVNSYRPTFYHLMIINLVF